MNMIFRLLLVAILAVSFFEGATAKHLARELQENNIIKSIHGEEAAREIEQKETKEEVEKMIAQDGLFKSVFGRLWGLIKDVVTAPFKFLMRVVDFIFLVPRLVVESFRQWTHKSKSS